MSAPQDLFGGLATTGSSVEDILVCRLQAKNVARIAAIAGAATFLAIAGAVRRRKHGGSTRSNAPNRQIGRKLGSQRIQADYFSITQRVFSEAEFERRFRVPMAVWEVLKEGVLRADRYFYQRKDAAGVLGARTYQKMGAAVRQLSYGIPADACVEYVRLSESTCNESLHRFCRAVVKEFESEWLRLPTVSEIEEIERHYAKLGFPGCIGCVDCASWEWDACPVGWQGADKGKDKKPVCRMEVVIDDFLRIYHCMFGAPGAKNDLNILNQSTIFNEVCLGNWPPVRPETSISGMPLTWYYYLADGIYPRYRIFVTTISDPRTKNGEAIWKAPGRSPQIRTASIWCAFQTISDSLSTITALEQEGHEQNCESLYSNSQYDCIP
jgi:Plant transposon protein